MSARNSQKHLRWARDKNIIPLPVKMNLVHLQNNALFRILSEYHKNKKRPVKPQSEKCFIPFTIILTRSCYFWQSNYATTTNANTKENKVDSRWFAWLNIKDRNLFKVLDTFLYLKCSAKI